MGLTYRGAGVDAEAGDELVERIEPLARMTRIAEVLEGVGGFASAVRVPGDVEEPVLVSGTDGVGTKLALAFATGVHDTVGQDLVAMCVNDVLTTGARPLFFLDYFATGKLDVAVAERVVRGIALACKECGMALVGGETAELPGMYADGEYDLAGFAVGVVARRKLVTGERVEPGDRVLGLPSSGLHSNGYSLARRVAGSASLSEPFAGRTLGSVLLEPTRLYAKTVRALLERPGVDVRAMAHVTGGGIPGNVPRVLPEGLGVRITGSWARPAIFDWIARRGPVEEREMRRTFNLGVGYVLVVARASAPETERALVELGESPIGLGEVVAVSHETPFEDRVEWG